MKNNLPFKIIGMLSMVLIMSSCNKKEKIAINSDAISVIPQPKSIEAFDGLYTISQDVKIYYKGDLKNVAAVLSNTLNSKNEVHAFDGENENSILLVVSESEKLEKEGYELTIDGNGIRIVGDKAGVFYGVQTLLQLLVESDSKTVVPYVHIVDNPQFKWRGMHLDVSRHFFDIAFIKKYIDIIAMHKLNVFHWHLTDDHGWRIEIDKYPKLTEIASWRAGDGMERPWNYDVQGAVEGEPRYGGFYTKDDIREVLTYAEERFVTVVPEIELPGHTWAVLHAYPNLSCTGNDWHLGEEWSFSDPFCAGNEETFTFLEDVLTEVIDLFPSQYIHIGGDEAQKTNWEKCSKCQARIKNEDLENEEELQSYFIKRIEKFIQSKGRKLIGWDEILEGGLAPDATVMSWQGEEGGIEAAKQKHDVIMTPWKSLYFNSPQLDPELEKIPLEDILNLETVYNYNPVPKELTDDEKKYVIGVQACLWTEHVYTEEMAIKQLMPRLTALSEIAWVPNDDKNWEYFQEKLKKHLLYLDKNNIDYFRH